MIRKTIFSGCAALALAGGLATTAFADTTHDIDTQDVFFNTLSFADGLDTSGTFGATSDAKGTFDDVFRFFAPPIWSVIQFDGAIDYVANKASVNFTGFDFGVVNGENYDLKGKFLGVNVTSLGLDQSYQTKFSFGGESADYLGSGVYYIEVMGQSLVAGGGFSGHINTTAIPEPDNMALLLAGLGVIGTLARRR